MGALPDLLVADSVAKAVSPKPLTVPMKFQKLTHFIDGMWNTARCSRRAPGVASENRAVAGLETRRGQQRALEFLPGHLDGSVRHPSRRHRRRGEQRTDSGGNGNGAGFDAKGHDRPPG